MEIIAEFDFCQAHGYSDSEHMKRRTRAKRRLKLTLFLAGQFLCGSLNGLGDTVVVRTDATWRTIKGNVTVGSDWNSNVNFDDSDQAGWTNSFKAPNGDRIWNTSNLSSESPANPRFRHVFSLYGSISSCIGHFGFDDDATVWINGLQVLNDTNGSASTFDNVVLDPSLFHAGTNLIAVWGHNTLAPYNTIEVDITNTIAAPAPIILVHDGHFGIQAGRFGFTISASLGQTITVETSSNLAAWFPLATNVLATNTLYYGDPSLPNQPSRFYRLRSP